MRCFLLTLAVLTAAGAAAQPPEPLQTANGERLMFDVASIKRNTSGDLNTSVRFNAGGQLVVTNNSLYNLIRNA